MMVNVVWREWRKFRVQAEIAYEATLQIMVGQYILGTLQVHRGMDEVMPTQFSHHPEVSQHNNK